MEAGVGTRDLDRLAEGCREGGEQDGAALPVAPAGAADMRGIVGLRMPITRLEGKRKMSQNRGAADRAGVIAGLAASEDPSDRAAAPLVPR